MTENLALDYIKRRMNELGYGDQYHLRFRHLLLNSKEELKIKAYNSFFVLAEMTETVHISCMSAIFDMGLENINELKYEFHGDILVKNKANRNTSIKFIQVIPYKQKL